MGLPLSKKLEQLGADGRARLGRAWLDPEVTVRVIEQRFGFGPPDIEQLKVLLGARVGKPVAVTSWRRRDDERKGVERARR